MTSSLSKYKSVLVFIAAIFICLLILLAARGGCSSNSSGGSPLDTVRAAVNALPSRDAEKVASYFTGQSHEDMLDGLTIFYIEYETVSVSNIGLNLEHIGPTIATAYLAYDLTVSSYGHSNTQHYAHIVQVVKLNGKWYLNSKI